jgi:hypothetical protein
MALEIAIEHIDRALPSYPILPIVLAFTQSFTDRQSDGWFFSHHHHCCYLFNSLTLGSSGILFLRNLVIEGFDVGLHLLLEIHLGLFHCTLFQESFLIIGSISF